MHFLKNDCWLFQLTKFLEQSSSLVVDFFFKIPRSVTFSKKLLWAVSNFALSTSFFSSSMSLFNFALLFWNHVITWAFVRPKLEAISSLSAGLRYFWYRNLFSSSKIWWFVNAVRDFRFFFGCCRLLNMLRASWPSEIKEKLLTLIWT